jgi:hypothetical protein
MGDLMIYRLYTQTNQTRTFTEKCSGSKIPYRTTKIMRELYPDGDFVIIGEVKNFSEAIANQDVLVTSDGKALPILPRGSFIKPFEWIAGYIAVGENTYVAVIKSVFPAFFRRRKRKLF